MSFLIQRSPGQRSFASSPGHIAGYHVFRRLSMPRHPPCTLSSLTTFTDHRHTPGRRIAAAALRDRHATDRVPRSHRKGARLVTPGLDSRSRIGHRCPTHDHSTHPGGESCNTQKNLERQNYSLVKELGAKPIASRTTHSSCDERGQVSRKIRRRTGPGSTMALSSCFQNCVTG